MKNYSYIQKFLHDLVLSKKFINKSLFEFEKIFFLKRENFQINDHIFITSLPRSGTTSILNYIHSSEQFASLTYRNMPFILSPNISKLLNKKNILKKERLHGDGILYDLDSPEAFDEVFFRNDDNFIKNELLNYLQLVLLSKNKSRYLSKNNLNYKRIDLINSILPNSIFLIPIRDPLQHCYSLLIQHLKFIEFEKKDDFIRRYKNYLGHKEFGIDHKPWNIPKKYTNSEDINYWLEQWLSFYNTLYDKYKIYKNCVFVIYEELSNRGYLELLSNKINLSDTLKYNYSYFKNSNKNHIDVNFDLDILKKAKITYSNIKKNYINI
jgi:hypothetical protein